MIIKIYCVGLLNIFLYIHKLEYHEDTEIIIAYIMSEKHVYNP